MGHWTIYACPRVMCRVVPSWGDCLSLHQTLGAVSCVPRFSCTAISWHNPLVPLMNLKYATGRDGMFSFSGFLSLCLPLSSGTLEADLNSVIFQQRWVKKKIKIKMGTDQSTKMKHLRKKRHLLPITWLLKCITPRCMVVPLSPASTVILRLQEH